MILLAFLLCVAAYLALGAWQLADKLAAAWSAPQAEHAAIDRPESGLQEQP